MPKRIQGGRLATLSCDIWGLNFFATYERCNPWKPQKTNGTTGLDHIVNMCCLAWSIFRLPTSSHLIAHSDDLIDDVLEEWLRPAMTLSEHSLPIARATQALDPPLKSQHPILLGKMALEELQRNAEECREMHRISRINQESRTSRTTGWWLGHPSEKYESQLGWLDTQYFWENKIHGNQTTNQNVVCKWFRWSHPTPGRSCTCPESLDGILTPKGVDSN